MAGTVKIVAGDPQLIEPPHRGSPAPFAAPEKRQKPSDRRVPAIALLATAGIAIHLVLRYAVQAAPQVSFAPLYAVLLLGGLPLLVALGRRLFAHEFGSDLLAGISILTSVLQGEYLVGSIVVLMLSGGTALEEFTSRRASSILDALANRMPQTTHRRVGEQTVDVSIGPSPDRGLLVRLPARGLPSGWPGRRGPRKNERGLSYRRTVRSVQGPGLQGHLRSAEWGNSTDHSNREIAQRFPIRSHHARYGGHAAAPSPAAPSGGPTGRVVHAGCSPDRSTRVAAQQRFAPLPGRISNCDPVPAADRDTRGRHRGDRALGALRHHHQESRDT